jgi:hypothetical protein
MGITWVLLLSMHSNVINCNSFMLLSVPTLPGAVSSCASRNYLFEKMLCSQGVRIQQLDSGNLRTLPLLLDAPASCAARGLCCIENLCWSTLVYHTWSPSCEIWNGDCWKRQPIVLNQGEVWVGGSYLRRWRFLNVLRHELHLRLASGGCWTSGGACVETCRVIELGSPDEWMAFSAGRRGSETMASAEGNSTLWYCTVGELEGSAKSWSGLQFRRSR